jgi:hypothetical protein
MEKEEREREDIKRKEERTIILPEKELTPCDRVTLKKLKVAQLVNIFPTFYRTQSSLLCLQEAAERREKGRKGKRMYAWDVQERRLYKEWSKSHATHKSVSRENFTIMLPHGLRDFWITLYNYYMYVRG